MTKEFDLAVLIGRFQPFHNGHVSLLAKALEIAPRVVLIIGSAFAARSANNPFNWQERAAMIASTLDETQRERVSFLPQRDCYDDIRWVTEVTAQVSRQANGATRVALIGNVHDAADQYLHRFPRWEFIAMPRQEHIDANSLRRIWYEGEEPQLTRARLVSLAPPPVLHYLQGWAQQPCFAELRTEHLAIEKNKITWGTGPFITVDAIVKASNQILLVKRGRAPGKGLWALPGGFLDERERVLQGAIRELREETGFGLQDVTLEDALAGVAVFDQPDRSARGRTITHAHYFDLKETQPPQVEGADDAVDARWVPIEELKTMEADLFEDHFSILDHFLALTA